MYVAQTRVLFLSLSGSSRGILSTYNKGLPALLERIDRLVCSRGCTKQCIYTSKFWFIYLGFDRLGIQLIFTVLSNLYFSVPHHHHNVSNHPIISKLMHHFYLQCFPSHNLFDPWDVEHLLSLLEGLAPVSSVTDFKIT